MYNLELQFLPLTDAEFSRVKFSPLSLCGISDLRQA